MIKLTRLAFELKKDAKRMADDVLSSYQEDVERSKLLDLPAPTKPFIDYKPKDFIETEYSYGIQLKSISDVSISSDGYTAIEKTNGDVIAVKEDINDVIAMIEAEEEKVFKNK